MGGQLATVGDWITLKAGVPVKMEVLFGEWTGGMQSGMLTVEVKGEKYPKNRHHGPLLPAFKTAEFTRDQIEEIQIYLYENEVSLTNGPVFRDYSPPDRMASTVSPDSEVLTEDESNGNEKGLPIQEKDRMRTWTSLDGRTIEAEFMLLYDGTMVILNDLQGKQHKIPLDYFCAEDFRNKTTHAS